jgi:hypothetical protein
MFLLLQVLNDGSSVTDNDEVLDYQFLLQVNYINIKSRINAQKYFICLNKIVQNLEMLKYY